ncbi:hypothetical protein GOP47_0024848 [Adiantum capillus-veneris]|uniref:Uncharacterized protein n=1 Tax=Adiantum capillus-veneris TaxID=13818 RepID=A0A9D4Z303_ADICA|nr:hypothetical protein GOP47_0024848 [Adiantum capillus-veneris]
MSHYNSFFLSVSEPLFLDLVEEGRVGGGSGNPLYDFLGQLSFKELRVFRSPLIACSQALFGVLLGTRGLLVALEAPWWQLNWTLQVMKTRAPPFI